MYDERTRQPDSNQAGEKFVKSDLAPRASPKTSASVNSSPGNAPGPEYTDKVQRELLEAGMPNVAMALAASLYCAPEPGPLAEELRKPFNIHNDSEPFTPEGQIKVCSTGSGWAGLRGQVSLIRNDTFYLRDGVELFYSKSGKAELPLASRIYSKLAGRFPRTVGRFFWDKKISVSSFSGDEAGRKS